MRNLSRRLAVGGVLLAASLTVAWTARPDGAALDIGNGFSDPTRHPPSAAASAVQDLVVVGFGHVDVEGGTVPLTVPALGQVEAVLVREGDQVKTGTPLIRLRCEAARSLLLQAEAAVAEARVKLAQAQRAPERHALLVQLQEQAAAAAQSRWLGQQRQVEKLEQLYESRNIADENYQSARDRLRELAAALKVEQLRLDQLRLENPREMIQLAEAALAAAEAQRDRAREALQQHTLVAPEDGVILRLAVSNGQILSEKQTQPAVWFCPSRPRIVRCEIDQEFSGRVVAGLVAELFAEGDETPSWHGRVTRAADWIAPRRSLLDEPMQRNDVRTLECTIAFEEGNRSMPRIGQRLRVVLRRDLATPAAARPSATNAAAQDTKPLQAGSPLPKAVGPG